jgi:hypothetical protein
VLQHRAGARLANGASREACIDPVLGARASCTVQRLCPWLEWEHHVDTDVDASEPSWSARTATYGLARIYVVERS